MTVNASEILAHVDREACQLREQLGLQPSDLALAVTCAPQGVTVTVSDASFGIGTLYRHTFDAAISACMAESLAAALLSRLGIATAPAPTELAAIA